MDSNYNIIDMDSLKAIDYRVKDANNYYGCKNSKTIDKINQKHSQFTFMGESEYYQLSLLLSSPAIIHLLQIKLAQVHKVEVEYINGQHVVSRSSHTLDDKQKKGGTFFIKNGQKSEPCTRLNIKLINQIPVQATIFYVLLKGEKDNSEKKTKPKVSNISKDDEQFKPRTPLAEKHLAIFSQRRKKAQPNELMEQAINKPFTPKPKRDKSEREDADLQKVLELSKREYQKEQNRKRMDSGKEQSKVDVIKIDDYEEPFEDLVNYKVVDYTEKMKKVYEHVTGEWLEAQKNAQKKINVIPKHSLGNKIKVKVFRNMKFCINSIFGIQRNKLIRLIRQLGGQYLDQPQNHCIIVTNKHEGNVISLAKGMAGLWMVTPDYVFNCEKVGIKLPYQDYRVKD